MRLFDLEHAATRDDWYTPPWIFDLLGIEFDIDVASPPGGVPWIPAKQWYDQALNGLAQPWFGTVWCNPPYSSPIKWCQKWVAHANGFIVLRADLSSGGQFAAMSAADFLFVSNGRLNFVNGHGEGTGAVDFSTVILSVGPQASALRNLSDRGLVRRLS